MSRLTVPVVPFQCLGDDIDFIEGHEVLVKRVCISTRGRWSYPIVRTDDCNEHSCETKAPQRVYINIVIKI